MSFIKLRRQPLILNVTLPVPHHIQFHTRKNTLNERTSYVLQCEWRKTSFNISPIKVGVVWVSTSILMLISPGIVFLSKGIFLMLLYLLLMFIYILAVPFEIMKKASDRTLYDRLDRFHRNMQERLSDD